jgi:hypothetical protein
MSFKCYEAILNSVYDVIGVSTFMDSSANEGLFWKEKIVKKSFGL